MSVGTFLRANERYVLKFKQIVIDIIKKSIVQLTHRMLLLFASFQAFSYFLFPLSTFS